MYLVEGRAAFAEMCFCGVDIVVHDISDRCDGVLLTIAVRKAVYKSKSIPDIASSTAVVS